MNARTVTLDGEIFDPSGTVTGGARPQSRPILALMMRSKGVVENLKGAEAELNEVREMPIGVQFLQVQQCTRMLPV